MNHGNNVKVNQNCLNLTDPDLQGRAQANNEPSIAVDPFNPRHLVASDNNYIRGDGTCGSYYSLDGARSWNDATTPNGFTRGPAPGSPVNTGRPAATLRSRGTRAATRTSAARRSTAGTVASPNPDQSSTFLMFRSTQNNGASFNFPGRYSTR